MGFGCNAKVKVSQEKVCQNQKRDNKVPNVIFYFIFFRYLTDCLHTIQTKAERAKSQNLVKPGWIY